MNTLILQDLFYKLLNDLELAENSLYNDELSKQMKYHCEIKRKKYLSDFKKLLQVDSNNSTDISTITDEVNNRFDKLIDLLNEQSR